MHVISITDDITLKSFRCRYVDYTYNSKKFSYVLFCIDIISIQIRYWSSVLQSPNDLPTWTQSLGTFFFL